MSRGFISRTMLPWITLFESVLNNELIPENEQGTTYIKFNVEGLLRANLENRYKSYQIGINSGFLSANEAREKEDMNPRDGGDEYLTPMNMTSNEKDEDTGKEDNPKNEASDEENS